MNIVKGTGQILRWGRGKRPGNKKQTQMKTFTLARENLSKDNAPKRKQKEKSRKSKIILTSKYISQYIFQRQQTLEIFIKLEEHWPQTAKLQ